MKYAELCARLDSNTWDPDDHRQAADAISELATDKKKCLNLLQAHGIHIEEPWCWCKPEVKVYED